MTGNTPNEDRLKDLAHLSGAVGHFLINAFSAVVSNAEQIRTRTRGPLDAAQIDILSSSIVKTALDASQVARRLIDATRHPSFIGDESGRSEARVVDFNQLIQETIESTNLMSSGIDRVLNLGPIPPIPGDADRLRSMLRHLIQNSVEAMAGGSGTLTISTHTDARGWAIIEVNDTGSGISPEVLRQATEPFYSTKPEHIGIGLTIAQAIWRRHRGSLAIDSQAGRGTTIRLSVGPPPPPRQAPQTAPREVPPQTLAEPQKAESPQTSTTESQTT
jgi:signal transduction histidine kinase